MIKAMVFDVDDTLYDLSVPFRRTAEEVFPGEKLDLYGTFLASRKYGDQVYAQSFRGEMSLRDMYIYRYQNAFADFEKKIDAETALKFQAVYERGHGADAGVLGEKGEAWNHHKRPGTAPVGQGSRPGSGTMDPDGAYSHIRRGGSRQTG